MVVSLALVSKCSKKGKFRQSYGAEIAINPRSPGSAVMVLAGPGKQYKGQSVGPSKRCQMIEHVACSTPVLSMETANSLERVPCLFGESNS